MNQEEETEKLKEAFASEEFASSIQVCYEKIEQWMNETNMEPQIKSSVLYSFLTNIFASLLMNEVHREGWSEICQKFTSKAIEMAESAYSIKNGDPNV